MNVGPSLRYDRKNKRRNTSRSAQSITSFIGRGEAPPEVLAKQEDEDGIRVLSHPVGKPQPPLVYRTDDYMVRVIIVGKGWLKDAMSVVKEK